MTASRPWWQAAKTARRGFLMGTWWAVLALPALLLVVVGGDHAWYLIMQSASQLALAGLYLVTAVALRRRERSSSADSQSRSTANPVRLPGAESPGLRLGIVGGCQFGAGIGPAAGS